jgi:hypothetical protein
MRYDISRKNEYATQRDNAKRPGASCNVTSVINACRASGIRLVTPEGVQAEDYLMGILEGAEARAEFSRRFPGATCHPWNVSPMLEWVANKVAGRRICITDNNTSIKDIMFHIVKEQAAVVIGGDFTVYGHIVTVVGFDTTQENILAIHGPEEVDQAKLAALVIDDPYGDYRTKYQDHNGDSVPMPLDDFKKIVYSGGRMRKIALKLYNTLEA